MKQAKDSGTNAGGVRLDGRATVEHLRDISARIQEALASAPAVTIDLTDVTRADLAFVQLLLSALKTAREQGVGLTVRADEALIIEASGGSRDAWTMLV